MEAGGYVFLVCKMQMQRSECSCAKRAHLLSLNKIREIIMDSDSNKVQYNASGMEDEEMEPRPPLRKSPLSQPVSSSDFSTSASEDEDVIENVTSQQRQSTQGILPPYPRMRVLHPFTGATKGKSSEAAHVTLQSTPLSVLMLFFVEIITLLVVETNRYYHDCLDSTDEQHHPQHDVTETEMFVFLALTLQMGHTIQGRLEDYWTKSYQLCCPFYRQTMAHSRFYHILWFLHFTDNNRTADSHDRLWKITDLFEILRTNFAKF